MQRRIIDLTFLIHEGMTTYPKPWHPVVEITQLGRHGIENRETRKLVLGTHTGTHLDAPRHFIPKGDGVNQIPLDILVGPASVLDFSSMEPNTEIREDDLKKKIGNESIERLILRFDWHRKWGSMEYYKNHPYLSIDAARWLLSVGVRLVAMDTPMPDNPNDPADSGLDSPVHKVFLGNSVVLVEYLTNLDQLQKSKVELIVLPLKLLDADGSPVRCIAIER